MQLMKIGITVNYTIRKNNFVIVKARGFSFVEFEPGGLSSRIRVILFSLYIFQGTSHLEKATWRMKGKMPLTKCPLRRLLFPSKVR
jgi:hypothetical protein